MSDSIIRLLLNAGQFDMEKRRPRTGLNWLTIAFRYLDYATILIKILTYLKNREFFSYMDNYQVLYNLQ
jgi:hypothetical protein